MAYVNQPDVEQPGAIPQASTGGGTIGAGGTTTQNPSLAIAAPTAETKTPAAAQKTSAPGFTNLSQYLQQNAPQADRLAGQVGDYVTQQGNEAKAAIKQAGDVFNAQAATGTTALDQNLVNKVKTDTTGVASNADEAAAFQKMMGANYSGPQSLADTGQSYVDAQNKITQAEQLANSLQSDSTRRNIFSESGISNDATLGKNILNNLLLGDHINNIRPQAEALNTLRPDLAAAEAAATQTAQQGAATSTATKAEIANQFTNPGAFVDTTKNDIQTRLNQVQQGQQQEGLIAAMKAALAPGTDMTKLTPNQLQSLGATQAEVNSLLAAQKDYEATAQTKETARLTAVREAGLNNDLAALRKQQLAAPKLQITKWGDPNPPVVPQKSADGLYHMNYGDILKALGPQPRGTNPLAVVGIGPQNWVQRTSKWGPQEFKLTPHQTAVVFKALPAVKTPAAATFTTPYDLSLGNVQKTENAPYESLVQNNAADTAAENSRLQALSQLLGVPLTAPMASADNLSKVTRPYSFNVQDAIKQLQAAKKGLK